MAKFEDPRVSAAVEQWAASLGAEGVKEAQEAVKTRQRNPAAAAQADSRPAEPTAFTDPADMPPMYKDLDKYTSDPIVRQDPISLNDQAMSESPPRVGDGPQADSAYDSLRGDVFERMAPGRDPNSTFQDRVGSLGEGLRAGASALRDSTIGGGRGQPPAWIRAIDDNLGTSLTDTRKDRLDLFDKIARSYMDSLKPGAIPGGRKPEGGK